MMMMISLIIIIIIDNVNYEKDFSHFSIAFVVVELENALVSCLNLKLNKSERKK